MAINSRFNKMRQLKLRKIIQRAGIGSRFPQKSRKEKQNWFKDEKFEAGWAWSVRTGSSLKTSKHNKIDQLKVNNFKKKI